MYKVLIVIKMGLTACLLLSQVIAWKSVVTIGTVITKRPVAAKQERLYLRLKKMQVGF